MNTSATNPYEPPTSNAKPPGADGEKSTEQSGSFAICMTSVLTTAAYLGFVIDLIVSDQEFGWVFVYPAFLLVCLTCAANRSTKLAAFFGVAVSTIQSTMMVGCLFVFADFRKALVISACTILPMVAITVWSWRHSRWNA